MEEEPDKEKLKKFNTEQKKIGTEKMLEFITPGKPGEQFKKDFNEILYRLTISEYLKQSNTNKEPFNNGRCKIIPSFFKLMEKLKEDKRDFAIVFRSFGLDIQNVISEFNEYF